MNTVQVTKIVKCTSDLFDDTTIDQEEGENSVHLIPQMAPRLIQKCYGSTTCVFYTSSIPGPIETDAAIDVIVSSPDIFQKALSEAKNTSSLKARMVMRFDTSLMSSISLDDSIKPSNFKNGRSRQNIFELIQDTTF